MSKMQDEVEMAIWRAVWVATDKKANPHVVKELRNLAMLQHRFATKPDFFVGGKHYSEPVTLPPMPDPAVRTVQDYEFRLPTSTPPGSSDTKE